MHLRLLACSAFAFTTGLVCAAPGAFSQMPTAKPRINQEGEIIVTAQRREQSIKDVPIAVTAFGDDALDELQVANAADLQLVVPNFSYTATNFGGVNYTIRGIGASVLGDGADTGVALHYNGAFLQGGGNANLFFDVEAVEVLRGPQGTLFGRNATGGAVNLRTHRPVSQFEAEIEGWTGSFETRGLEVMLNAPLSSSVAFRISALYEDDDGDIKNITTGNQINGTEVFFARPSLHWTRNNDTTVDLSFTYLRADGDGLQAERRGCLRDPIGNLGCLPTGLGNELPNYTATLSGLIATEVGLIAPGSDPFAGSANPADPHNVALDFDPRAFTENRVATFEVEHDFGVVKLNVLTAWATEDGFYENDPDFSVAAGAFEPVFLGGVPTSAPDPANLGSLAGRVLGVFSRPYAYERGEGQGRQWLQEVRLASGLAGSFDFLIGAFWMD